MFGNLSITTVVEKKGLLDILVKNREEHRKIVREAREGYVEDAKRALAARLDELKSGKIAGLQFSLVPPSDYTSVYDTAIRMLEMHTGDTVTLEASEFRNMVMDAWDWQKSFLHSNLRYSGTASAKWTGLYETD